MRKRPAAALTDIYAPVVPAAKRRSGSAAGKTIVKKPAKQRSASSLSPAEKKSGESAAHCSRESGLARDTMPGLGHGNAWTISVAMNECVRV